MRDRINWAVIPSLGWLPLVSRHFYFFVPVGITRTTGGVFELVNNLDLSNSSAVKV